MNKSFSFRIIPRPRETFYLIDSICHLKDLFSSRSTQKNLTNRSAWWDMDPLDVWSSVTIGQLLPMRENIWRNDFFTFKPNKFASNQLYMFSVINCSLRKRDDSSGAAALWVLSLANAKSFLYWPGSAKAPSTASLFWQN